MKLFWKILAGICIMVATFFVWRRDFDTAFVLAVLGLVAWFLNYRAQFKEIIVAANVENETREDEEDSRENSDAN